MSPAGIRAAGRELDALIAEQVMRWSRLTEGQIYGARFGEVYPTATQSGFGPDRVSKWWFDKGTPNSHGEPRAVAPAEDIDGDWPDEFKRFAPSTDIAAAWEVVERFDTWEVLQMRNPDRVYASVTKWRPEGFGRATAETAPHAICLAALAAVGAEPPEGAPQP